MKAAEADGRTLSNWVQKAIDDALERERQKKPN